MQDVLLIGNSQTSHNFRLTHLNRAVSVENRAAMTISEARKEVEKETKKRGVMILHELTNDIGTNETEAVKSSNEFFDIIKLATTKAQKVIVSLGLPRNDDATKHQLTQMINWRLKTRLQENCNVIVCEHDNMLYYGQPNKNYLARDGYHLSTMGKVMFSQNLVQSIHRATGLPSPYNNPKRGNGRHPNGWQYKDYNYNEYNYA